MATSAPYLRKEDIDSLKDYVRGTGGQSQAESTVLLHCTHSNLMARFFEIRLDKHVGAPPSSSLHETPKRCVAYNTQRSVHATAWPSMQTTTDP
jgi:hypothetical protein